MNKYRFPKIEEFVDGFEFELSTSIVQNTLEKGLLEPTIWYKQIFGKDIKDIEFIKYIYHTDNIRVLDILIIKEPLFSYGESKSEGRAELRIHVSEVPKDCKKINEFYDFEIEILNKVNPKFFEEWKVLRIIPGTVDRETLGGERKARIGGIYSHTEDYEFYLIKK